MIVYDARCPGTIIHADHVNEGVEWSDMAIDEYILSQSYPSIEIQRTVFTVCGCCARELFQARMASALPGERARLRGGAILYFTEDGGKPHQCGPRGAFWWRAIENRCRCHPARQALEWNSCCWHLQFLGKQRLCHSIFQPLLFFFFLIAFSIFRLTHSSTNVPISVSTTTSIKKQGLLTSRTQQKDIWVTWTCHIEAKNRMTSSFYIEFKHNWATL